MYDLVWVLLFGLAAGVVRLCLVCLLGGGLFYIWFVLWFRLMYPIYFSLLPIGFVLCVRVGVLQFVGFMFRLRVYWLFGCRCFWVCFKKVWFLWWGFALVLLSFLFWLFGCFVLGGLIVSCYLSWS